MIQKLAIEKTTVWFWKINEPLEKLRHIKLCKNSLKRLSKIKNKTREKSFLATRHLLNKIGDQNDPLKYDPFGKPFLKSRTPISISHSHDFVAIAIGGNKLIGIDIEKIGVRIKKIAPRFLSPQNMHITDAHSQTLIWCAKEAMYKAYPIKKICFSRDMYVKMPCQKNIPKETTGFISVGKKINFKLFFGNIEKIAWVVALE